MPDDNSRMKIAVILMAVCGLIFLAVALAQAHEATDVNGNPLGWNFEQWCCQERDCSVVPDQTVKPIGGGLQITLMPGDHPLVTRKQVFQIQQSKLRKSPDGRTYVCLYPTEANLRCVYHPPMGF